MLSHTQLFTAQWSVAHQAPLSLEFYRQEHLWVAISFSGDLSNPGIKPLSLDSPALAGGFFTIGAIWEALNRRILEKISQGHFSVP